MTRQFAAAAVLLVLTAGFRPQQDSFRTNFREFKGVAPGVDFYAGSRNDVAPFEKPVREAQAKLDAFVGKSSVRGAVVICSSLEQKDSVSESRLLRQGYRWTLIQVTPEVAGQQRLAQLKAQMGDMVPPALLERFQNPSPEMRAASIARLVGSAVQKIATAILVTTLEPDKDLRSSRLEDMARSPLADWLDIGLVSHASGGGSNLRFLQDRIDEAFPLEDIISMSRPFVAPTIEGLSANGGQGRGSSAGDSGGPAADRQGNPGAGSGEIRMMAPDGVTGRVRISEGGSGSGRAQSGNAGSRDGGTRGGGRAGDGGGGMRMMNLPKDVQDRMLFDAEASSFFGYLMGKIGPEKCRTLVQASLAGKNVRGVLLQNDMMGPDVDAIEREWLDWVKKQKPEGPGMIQFRTTQDRPGPNS